MTISRIVLTTLLTENTGAVGVLETEGVGDGETLTDGVGVRVANFGVAVHAASSAKTTRGLRMLWRRCARRQNDAKCCSPADDRVDRHASAERGDQLADDRQPEARSYRLHAL